MLRKLNMLLKLAIVAGLSTVCLSATYDQVENVPRIDWDFIIVGGGVAGSVLASRLSENPNFNVLVLEAGPTNQNVTDSIVPGLQMGLASTRYDWNYTTVPLAGLNNRSVTYQRGHILGGSSSVNGMIYTRGSSSDYDRFAEVTGDPGWSWKSIQRYLQRHEKFETPVDNHNITAQYDPSVHSTTGRVPVTLPGFSQPQIDNLAIRASEELGGEYRLNLDMNSGNPLGLGWLQSTIGHDGTRSSAATTYLDDATRARRNLHIVTNTFVTRVLPSSDAETLTIRTVEVRASETSVPINFTASKEVILSGGSIGSPLILMHSGIANAEKLREFGISPLLNNPSVGRNFSDHPLFVISFDAAPNSLDFGPWGNLFTDPAVQAKALEVWNTNRTGPYVELTPANHLLWTRLPTNITDQLGDPSSGSNSAHIEFIAGPFTPAQYNLVVLLVSPASRGILTISSNNPFDEPMIDPGYYSSGLDLVAARQALKQALTFASAPVFQNIITGLAAPFTNVTSDADIDFIIQNSTVSGLHPVGTASMSPKGAGWGVVDPDLRVKNVTGLRIVDASVMPQSEMILDFAITASLVTVCLSATYDHVEEVPILDWDFIIAGGGTAGSVLASRLSENPDFNVLVLEAGPTNKNVTNTIVPGLELRLANSLYDWNYTTVPMESLNNRSVSLQRGHLLGGSSSVNGMIYTRGSSSDYDRFAEFTGDPGWGWNNIQKYLRKHERFEKPADNHNTSGQYNPAVHSTTGRVPVTLPGFSHPQIDSLAVQASHELGGEFRYNLDMNSGDPLGLGWVQSTIGHDGTRSSAATTYLDDTTRARRNLHIVTNTFVTRVLPSSDAETLTIRTVEVKASDRMSTLVNFTASKEVILSGGSIGSPLILMHSGIANAEKLREFGITPLLDNPSVGKNFSDHPSFGISFDVAPSSLDFGPWGNLFTNPTVQAEALQLWNKNRTGPYVELEPTNHLLWTRLPGNVTEKLGDPSSGPNSAHIEFIVGAFTPAAYSLFVLLVSPESRGTLTISSNNPFDEPMIDPGYYSSEIDLVAARQALKYALAFSSAPVFRNVIKGLAAPFTNVTSDADIDFMIRNTTVSGLHPVGTASMSPTGVSWGVVDPDLRVKNVTGLRIVDASVMDTVTASHELGMLRNLAILTSPATVGHSVMYDRGNDVPVGPNWDFIIVGGGTAGSALASRLTENPNFKVLVLEAGPSNENVTSSIVLVPQIGLGNRNGMVYRTRGSSSDYNRFAEYSGEPEWRWDNFQQYLKRIDGLAIQASQRLGYFSYNVDMNSGDPLGLGWLHSTIGHDRTRSSAAAAYLNGATRARENLHIVTSALVTRVLPSHHEDTLTIRTIEVLVSDSAKPFHFTASNEAILCAIAIGSPVILMHSGIVLEGTLLITVFGISSSVTLGSLNFDQWGNLFSDTVLQAEALQIWNKNRTGPFVELPPSGHLSWTRVSSNIIQKLDDPSSGPNSAHLEFVTSRSDPAFYTSGFNTVAAREAIQAAHTFVSAPVSQDTITGVAAPFAGVTSDNEIDDILRDATNAGLHLVGTASMSTRSAI
ncbi:hypothetical protein NP233_g8092 [Leucocoprinus birnbaumii]|uniref:pyranose dehydrogenase (acceptor) n=1 Tax=Leucocoprinus birnbaumii TaxID=56174 RepID=A0AAD5YU55_9AGAR|nr:hypothetical protein NP233_g8092 [Leucocoprinus birnbaumii]